MAMTAASGAGTGPAAGDAAAGRPAAGGASMPVNRKLPIMISFGIDASLPSIGTVPRCCFAGLRNK
jgi:hypothetical protein